MDPTDLEIIDLLQRDGRLSNKTLAARAGLSPSACLERVRKLERDGVIARYAALLDKNAFGECLEGWVTITFSDRTASTVRAVAVALAEADIVIAAYELAAPFDVLIHVVAPGLACWRAVEAELERKLGPIGSVRFGMVIGVIKPISPLPTKRLSART
jgi:Lrp/AsnC family transcriptional regulator, leucine-responsive regulatory protein